MGWQLTIRAQLNAFTSYYIIVEPTALKDLAGNYFAGYSDSTHWKFETGQNGCTGSQVTSLFPERNSIVLPGSKVVIFFEDKIAKGAGDINLKRASDGAVMASVSVTSTDVEILENAVQVKLDFSKLPPDTYYVEVPATAFKGVSSGLFLGYAGPNGWRFTTTAHPNIEPLTVVSRSPENSASSVATNSFLKLKFNIPIKKGTGKIYVMKRNFNSAPFDVIVLTIDFAKSLTDVHYTINGSELSISTPLSPNTRYWIKVEQTAIQDLNGMPFEGYLFKSDWQFATAPTLNSKIEVLRHHLYSGSNIILNFDRTITVGSGVLQLHGWSNFGLVESVSMDRVTGSGSWAVFTAYNLLPGTAYHLMIPGTAFRDEDNNYLEASNGWNDYTVCVTGWSDVCREPFPHISSFTPSQAGDGDEVTIKGSFYSVLNVTFGGVTAASFSVVDIHTIKAVVGSGATGAVNVSGADGSGSLVGFTFMVPTAVEKELLPSLIDVSPNPSDGRKINFAFSSCAGRDQAVVTLIDMTGRIISSSTLECSPSVTWNFNPSGPITPGIYLISIQSQKDKIFKRVIVK